MGHIGHQTGDASIPPSGSGRASLLAALATAGSTVLLLWLGSGHTVDSRRFAALPEFAVWIWLYAVEVGAAAAFGVATWPAFRLLGRATGLRATMWAVGAWLVVALLLTTIGPRSLGGHSPLWLNLERTIAANTATLILIAPSFAGLLLVQTRLSKLRWETQSAVAAGKAGQVVVDLLWLRAAMQRFLVSFSVLITLGVLALGALRSALLAYGAPTEDVPVARILTVGGLLAALSALIFVPTYVSWQERVVDLRDRLYPVPEDGLPSRDWYQARSDFDTLLPARSSAGTVLAAAFGILAPLAGSLVATLIPIQ